jgi:hypothetical protein
MRPRAAQRFRSDPNARPRTIGRTLSSRLVLVAVLAGTAVTGVGCGGSSNSSTMPTGASAPSATTTATAAAPTTTTASGDDLSGTWNGKYSGAYQGTFVLDWKQSGSKLSGTIKLSAPNNTLDVNGTLQGSAIQFGTVGSQAITYTGTVTGDSMSGSYQTPGGGGPWSATKG